MNPHPTDRSNVRLTLPGGTNANDLPAERIRLYQADHPAGTDGAEERATDGYESAWLPDEQEREAIGAGAPIMLIIWGRAHPPVQLHVPAVPEGRAAIDRDHAHRTLGRLYTLLEKRLGDVSSKAESQYPPDALPEPTELLTMWEQALADTAQAPDVADRVIAELKARAADPDHDRDQALDRARQRYLRAAGGDKITAAARYALDAETVAGATAALDAAQHVFGLDPDQGERTMVNERRRELRELSDEAGQ